jgi:hypothetical protein
MWRTAGLSPTASTCWSHSSWNSSGAIAIGCHLHVTLRGQAWPMRRFCPPRSREAGRLRVIDTQQFEVRGRINQGIVKRCQRIGAVRGPRECLQFVLIQLERLDDRNPQPLAVLRHIGLVTLAPCGAAQIA